MREILFRGKRLDDGEWAYGYVVAMPNTGTVNIMSHSRSYTDKYGICQHEFFYHEVDPATVGQFTGLTDRNDKKIFEGDVVDYAHPFKNRTGRYVVRWQEYGFGCKGFYQSHYDEPSDAFSEGTSYFEIIGTIHDNPELLGGAE